MKKLLKDLSLLNGIPSQETQVRKYMAEVMKPDADEIHYDNLGSIIAKKTGKESGPRIMVAGHMDEVGFLVTRITDEGYVKFTPAGGWWSQVMLAQQLEITTNEGKRIRGVIGAKAPHILTPEERNKPVDIDKMYIDVGVKDKEAAEKLGIRVGDMITPYIQPTVLGDDKYYLGKAWDNRVGCAAAIEVLQRLKDGDHPNVYYGVGTVQEEVGLKGAKTSSHHIDPDIGIAVDTTISDDFPGGDKQTVLGGGVGIMVRDSSMIGHKDLRDFVLKVADENEINYQLTHLGRGGTDGGNIHVAHSGVPSIALVIPVRYIHSHTSVMHEDDYNAMVDLIEALVKALDADAVEKITYDA